MDQKPPMPRLPALDAEVPDLSWEIDAAHYRELPDGSVAYTAVLLHHGVAAGTVANDGRGGQTLVQLQTPAARDAWHAFAADVHDATLRAYYAALAPDVEPSAESLTDGSERRSMVAELLLSEHDLRRHLDAALGDGQCPHLAPGAAPVAQLLSGGDDGVPTTVPGSRTWTGTGWAEVVSPPPSPARPGRPR